MEMALGMSQADADAEGWRDTDEEGDKLKEAAHQLPFLYSVAVYIADYKSERAKLASFPKKRVCNMPPVN
jgi:hypothetical protein